MAGWQSDQRPTTQFMNAIDWLQLSRTVRFSDTDAAGVVHFQAILGWCHQAWEESLERYGLDAETVFPGGRNGPPSIALPIVHCNADFRAPMRMGDDLTIRLQPRRLDLGSFEVTSQIRRDQQDVARGCIRHVAIDANSRLRCELPDGIERWLEASCMGTIQAL